MSSNQKTNADWVAGIDLGTTYFKIGLFDRQGRLGGLGRVAVAAETGADGSRCELPVDRFEQRLRTAWTGACRAAGGDTGTIRVAGIAYSSQANSFLLLDGADRPLTPLVLWPDQRVERIAPEVQAYDRRSDRSTRTGIGLGISPSFAISKWAWWRETQPAIWQKTRRLMTISDYLVFRLVGRQAGDLGTAGLLGMVDPRAGDWWGAALADLHLDRSLLTPLSCPGTRIGLTVPGATVCGPPAGVPVALGGLDHHMAAIGLGVPVRAPVSVSLGTVLACLGVTPQYRPFTGGCCGRGFAGQGYTVLTFSASGGGQLEWYWRRYAADRTLADLDHEAMQIPIGCEGLTALPDAARRPDLSGFSGVTPRHTPAHYFRALMESSARCLNDLLQPMGNPRSLLLSGGGARSAPWREIIRATTGCEVLTGTCEEPACRGAAMAAAVAAGWFPSIGCVAAAWAG